MTRDQKQLTAVIVNHALSHSHPVAERLNCPASFCVTPARFLFLPALILDALGRLFHLLLSSQLQRVDSAVSRAAPTDVVVLRGKLLSAYLALAAGWLTHGHHPVPAPL